jgi:purine-cytosine permease-like protein
VDDGRLIRRILEGLSEGDPFSYVVIAIAVGVVAFMMWRLLREEDPPQTSADWVRLIGIVAAGAGAIAGLLGLVADVSFAPGVGQHVALFGSGIFFAGFLVALVSLTVKARTRLRRGGPAPGG